MDPEPAATQVQALGGDVSTKPYEQFLRDKAVVSPEVGYPVADHEVNQILLPHQRDIVRWMVLGGRRACFASFGLGKSVMQLEACRLALEKLGSGRALIICPLGVKQEFARDGRMLGIATTFIRRTEELSGEGGIWLTNYESVRDGRLDVSKFDVVSLDEAGVLRSYGSKTYQTFLDLFAETRFRFVATATPSPNKYKELIHYAGFLGIMDSGQALTRFFQRDSTKANNLTLYPHKEREFWLWLNTWAAFLQKPSDMGYPDTGYTLPDIEIVTHQVASDHSLAGVERDGQARMFSGGGSLGVSEAATQKRATLVSRVSKAAELVAESPDDHFILWHDLEDERRAIKAAIPEAVEVFGSLDLDVREQRIIDFSEGLFRILATKPELSGSGCNFQRHCHRAIFVGVGFKFHDFIQAVHRIQRFQQTERVRIDIIHAESEAAVVRTLMGKWEAHKKLVSRMSGVIREHGLNRGALEAEMTRSMGVQRREIRGNNWIVAHNDCVLETRAMAESSVDLVVTSIPFSNHYEYTPSYNDFGHTDNNEHFWAQMDYLTPQLLRILSPGRIYACHVKDRILFGGVTGAGAPTVSPFHAEAIMHSRSHGFDYLGMITVVTDVVAENNQTYRLGWTENSKDGTKMGVGSPEYILLFRKPQTDRSRGYADKPVTKVKADYTRARWQLDAHAFWRSSGDRPLTPQELREHPELFTKDSQGRVYNFRDHVDLGEYLEAKNSLPATYMSLAPGSWHPDVWTDVNRMRTLNTEQARRNLVMHVCPLQFDIVDRLIERYSIPGELVFDPFGGLATVPLRAVALGRRGHSSELNGDYWADSARYLRAQDEKLSAPTLFDLVG